MTNVTLYGFPVTTYVNVARLVLTQKNVPFAFKDLSAEMGGKRHNRRERPLSCHLWRRTVLA